AKYEREQDVRRRPGERDPHHVTPRMFEVANIHRNGLRPADVRRDQEDERSQRVEVGKRIERQPSEELRGRISQAERREAVRGLVEREREQKRRNEEKKPDRITQTPVPFPGPASSRGERHGREPLWVGRSVTSHECLNQRSAAARTSSGVS